MIPVLKPFLPPKQDYINYLHKIWETRSLTNMGPLSNDLEERLKTHLNVENLLFVSSGTMALQLAIKALDIKGEILTSPFSFVATTSSIVWEGCQPVFVDIDRQNLNIDADKIEEAITEKTAAILVPHIYGNPCDLNKLQKIADQYQLRLIYDGAHAFGVNVNTQSIFRYGDISVCSLNATKPYHTAEGGFMVINNPGIYKKIKQMRYFGKADDNTFRDLGINGKNSEFHAALGLANLDYIPQIHEKRKTLSNLYDHLLARENVSTPVWHSQANKNYTFYPIILDSEKSLLKVKHYLEENHIKTKRYFYPNLATALPYSEYQYCPISDDIAKRVLCLPLYADLNENQVRQICGAITKWFRYRAAGIQVPSHTSHTSLEAT